MRKTSLRADILCHCEPPSGEAISSYGKFASFLAMTMLLTISCNQPTAANKKIELDSLTTKVEQPLKLEVESSVNNKIEQPISAEQRLSKENTNTQIVTVQIFSNDTTADAALKGFGYNILMEGKMYVHQPHIPAVPGNKGFASVDDAKKAGTLIKYKVEHHLMPPSVTVQELDSLKIFY